MKGHLLKGEERVTVALRDNYNQSVDVEIISISRPANTQLAKGLWPFIGQKQNKFFELQMDFLKEVGRRTTTTTTTHNNNLSFLKGVDGKQKQSTGNSNNNHNTEGKLPSKFLMKGFDESNNRLGEDFDF